MTSEDGRLDPAVVAGLYLKHADELRRMLVGVLRDADLAGDVLQVAFARAVEVGHKAQAESFKAWLFRVAFNEAMAIRRRQAVHGRATDRIAAQGGPESETPEVILCRFETVEQVRSALSELPIEQQQVVRMRIYEQKKFITIAEELGLPLGTVLTRMQLALKKLRDKLKPTE
jgi:RNA polymerase sigma-70 factor (ECF subfamily)